MISAARTRSFSRRTLIVLIGTFWCAGIAGGQDKSGVSPSKISLPSGPGSIEGLGESFEPQLNTGTSVYGISIAVPPGVNGLQPSVRLAYNSGGGNGPFGIGWSLAVPAIQRQTDKGTPVYNDSDVFVSDGEELVPLDDGTWRCENETAFNRFRQVGDGWEYHDRNGTLYSLGTYPDESDPDRVSRVFDGFAGFGSTFKWSVDSVTDTSGNRMEYFYTAFGDSPGQLYLSEIRYSIFGDKYHSVHFEYESRSDAFSDFRSGFEIRTSMRCFRITVRSEGAPVRTYLLEYALNPDDPLGIPPERDFTPAFSLIRKVTQFGRDGVNYLPPLRLAYTRLDIADIDVRSVINPPPVGLDTGLIEIADLNSDGLPDFVYSPPVPGRRHEHCLNLGDGEFASPQEFDAGPTSVTLTGPAVQLADFDGDGQTDLILKSGADSFDVFRYFENGNRTDQPADGTIRWADPVDFPFPHPPIALNDPYTRMMDLDFDKKTDFITSTLYGVRYFLNRGEAGWEESGFYLRGEPILGDQSLADDLAFARIGSSGQPEVNPYVKQADLNGDRMQDLVKIIRYPLSIQIQYWPYKGNGWWGDRRVVGGELHVGPAADADIRLTDVNGDGLSDVVVLQYDQLWLYVNTGNDSFMDVIAANGTPEYISGTTQTREADINGNGSTDVIYQNWDPVSGTYRMEYVDFLPQGKVNLLAHIDNGIGLQTEIGYKSSVDDYIAAEKEGWPWLTRNPNPVSVVDRITQRIGQDLDSDGVADEYHTDLFYRDAYFDAFENEFRGFSYAQKVQRGDDFDPSSGATDGSAFLNVSAPSVVSRFHFHTGSPDGIDNDAYPAGYAGATPADETWPASGREEEPLKGRPLIEETIDSSALADAFASFNRSAYEFATGGAEGLTPESYIFKRTRSRYSLRRLYRPVDMTTPPGRFGSVQVLDPTGKSVTFCQADSTEVVSYEANGRMVSDQGYPVRFPLTILSETSFDDYGNTVLVSEWGFVEDQNGDGKFTTYDERRAGSDERITETWFAHGGQALSRWILSKPADISVTDIDGNFVKRTRNYYDGSGLGLFTGRPLTEIGARGLVSRVEEFINGPEDVADLPGVDFNVGDPDRLPGATLVSSRMAYDAHGNPVVMMDGLANPLQLETVPAQSMNLPFVDDVITSQGHIREIAYDPDFHTYPVREEIHIGESHGEPQPALVMTAGYDTGFGVVTTSTDFSGNVTDYGYDTFARLTSITKPLDTEELPTALYEYQPADPFRGIVYDYNREGALTELPTASSIIANAVRTHAREQHGSPATFDTTTYTDGLGRTLMAVEEDETTGTFVVKGATLFSRTTQPARTLQPYAQGGDAFHVPVHDEVLRPATDLYYDSAGRVVRTLLPAESAAAPADRRFTQTRYLPFETHEFDEEDNRAGGAHSATPMEYVNDGLGRLVEVRENVSGEQWVTRYRYDFNDNLVSITDSQFNKKFMRYDGLGRKIFMNDPDRGYMFYEYDDASNLTSTTDAKGQSIDYAYDGVNRLLTEDYADAGLSFSFNRDPDVIYHYDLPAPGGVDQGDRTLATATNTAGYLAFVEDLSGEEHMSYDARGRIEWKVKRIPDPDPAIGQLVAFRSGYSYDALDRMTAQTYPDNDRVTFAYNNRSLLEAIPGLIDDVDYIPSGQLDLCLYGNGVLTSYTYDPRLRMTTVLSEAPPGTNNNDTRLIDYTYTFDGASNITAIADNRPHVPPGDPRHNSQIFGYDNLYRLTGAQWADGKRIDYSYDRIGNMLSKASPPSGPGHIASDDVNLGGMAYGGDGATFGRSGRRPGDPPGPHALTSTDSGRGYPYDPNGNMTDIDGQTATWDFKDRLRFLDKTVDGDPQHSEYIYDYTDRRIAKKVSDAGTLTTTTLYIDSYFEMREADAPVKYVWNGSTRVARVGGTLDPARKRIQRVRLWPGQNLVCLAVQETAGFTAGDLFGLGQPGGATAVSYWDGADWSDLAPGDPMTAGEPYWIDVPSGRVVPVIGDYNPPGADLGLSVGDMPVGWPGLEPMRWRAHVADALTSGTLEELRAWDAAASPPAFVTRYFPEPALADNFPEKLPVGRAFWVDALMATVLRTSALQDPGAGGDPESIRFYHQDHLGSSNIIADAAGELIEETAFYPYGEPRNRHDAKGDGVDEKYLFTQKERDQESGLQYYGSRFHAGVLARFITPDPLVLQRPERFQRNPQNLNPYSYTGNSPIVFTDPSGELPTFAIGAIIGAATSAAVGIASQAADQLISNGHVEMSKFDYKAIAKETAKGAVEGAVSGGLSVISKVKSGSKLIGKATDIYNRYSKAKEKVDKMLDPAGTFVKQKVSTLIKFTSEKAGEIVPLSQRGKILTRLTVRKTLEKSADEIGERLPEIPTISDAAFQSYGGSDETSPNGEERPLESAPDATAGRRG